MITQRRQGAKPVFGTQITTAVALLVLSASAAAQIQVASDFSGGSGVVESIDQQAAVIRLMPDDHPQRGWRCWWYVKISGLTPGRKIAIDVGDAPWATPDQATYSSDGGQTWVHTDKGVRNGKRIRYQLSADATSILAAWGPPFVPADARELVQGLAARSTDAQAYSLCTTREDRETPALRVSASAGDDASKAGRPLIWIQARQHAWESGSSWVCRGFAEWLLSDNPQAAELRRRANFVIVPVMDIDNVHRGAGGKNQQPQDHNRDWSTAPHWRSVSAAQFALQAAAQENRLAAFIDLHNPSAGDRQPYFYLPPKEIQSETALKNQNRFLQAVKQNMTGPLKFTGRTIESGPRYDARMWKFISKNWVARLGTPAVSVTLETAWNTPASTTEGYLAVGRQLGQSLAQYMTQP